MVQQQMGVCLPKARTSPWLLVLLALTLVHCKGETASTPPPPVIQVEVAEVIQKDVPIFSEWVGTTDGLVNAEIRSQVTGYLLKRDYREGGAVKKGDLLFQIDPRKFQAALDQAVGDLKRAQAQLTKTKLDVARNEPLAKEGAISLKEFQDSVQANQAAGAAVESAKAAGGSGEAEPGMDESPRADQRSRGHRQGAGRRSDRCQQRVDVDVYSRSDPGVFSDQRAGIPQALRADGGALSGVCGVDPTIARKDARIEMVLSNGEVYPHKGWFFLADRQVDVKTGTIRVAALFPNPGNVMRPGQYAKIRASVTVRQGALLVPQRAVSEQQGSYQVAVVTPENKVETRPVTVGERIGSQWIIAQGLKPGEHVVVEGLQKLKAGDSVRPIPFETEPQTAPIEPAAQPEPSSKDN